VTDPGIRARPFDRLEATASRGIAIARSLKLTRAAATVALPAAARYLAAARLIDSAPAPIRRTAHRQRPGTNPPHGSRAAPRHQSAARLTGGAPAPIRRTAHGRRLRPAEEGSEAEGVGLRCLGGAAHGGKTPATLSGTTLR